MEKTKFDYFFSAFFLIIAAKTTFLTYYDIFWFIFSISCLSYGLYKRRIYVSDLYVFVGFTIIYIVYIIFRNVFFNKLDINYLLSDIFFLLKYILLAFIFCIVFKRNATILISEVIIKFAKISLILYIFQLLGGGEVLFRIGIIFHNIFPYPGNSETYSNFLIFTYDKLHSIRNSGFVWEPGAFGCFLTIGLLFHFMKNNFKFDRNSKILAVSILTTISTTAYLAFGVLMFLYYRVNGGIISIKMILGFAVGIVLFFSLPFLGDKIIQTYQDDVKALDDYEMIINGLDYFTENEGEVKLNRFASGVFLYRNFGHQLIFGVSNAYINVKSSVYGVEISKFNISNGIIDFIAKFGMIGLIFLFYRIGNFIYIHYQKLEFSLYIIFIILVMNFGEPLLILPITLIFLFLPRFSEIEEEDEEEDENEEEETKLRNAINFYSKK
ncbi:hypothetical protein SYJ56_20200 [Algoriphagus sp. D3-2-R+10]|uniref:hypothetical protein n=1 Tax=Algoriphagus aurantiacus TaxID=3103948 RepID=UPI002B3B9C9F|nr:hypothetical protein [Algoriphagus sp. D3-2-R+10]MEB2777650.1 hypothetical protein [Algoriphagus sp. D3-2-R+10]